MKFSSRLMIAVAVTLLSASGLFAEIKDGL